MVRQARYKHGGTFFKGIEAPHQVYKPSEGFSELGRQKYHGKERIKWSEGGEGGTNPEYSKRVFSQGLREELSFRHKCDGSDAIITKQSAKFKRTF